MCNYVRVTHGGNGWGFYIDTGVKHLFFFGIAIDFFTSKRVDGYNTGITRLNSPLEDLGPVYTIVATVL